jgi:hypothetical protein
MYFNPPDLTTLCCTDCSFNPIRKSRSSLFFVYYSLLFVFYVFLSTFDKLYSFRLAEPNVSLAIHVLPTITVCITFIYWDTYQYSQPDHIQTNIDILTNFLGTITKNIYIS